jgi:hypothetical protein
MIGCLPWLGGDGGDKLDELIFGQFFADGALLKPGAGVVVFIMRISAL